MNTKRIDRPALVFPSGPLSYDNQAAVSETLQIPHANIHVIEDGSVSVTDTDPNFWTRVYELASIAGHLLIDPSLKEDCKNKGTIVGQAYRIATSFNPTINVLDYAAPNGESLNFYDRASQTSVCRFY